MIITKDTRLKEVISLPEFIEFREYLNPFQGILRLVTNQSRLKAYEKIWNVDSICNGFNYMLSLCHAGNKIFYPIYDKEKVKIDSALKAQVLFHFPVEKKTKFVVICAGGGYSSVCSMVEAFPVAVILNKLGYHAFVVNYRVGKDALAPNPQDDLANAIAYILNHTNEFNIEKENYAVAGFSAGGHLVATFGTDSLGFAHFGLPKPAALFLAYPVITMSEKTHMGSKKNLLGKNNINNGELIEKYSVELQISGNYPPVYVWQCENDKEVPIDNTKLLVQALNKNEIFYKYKTYPGDAHGLGLGEGTSAEGWLEEAVDFWKQQVK